MKFGLSKKELLILKNIFINFSEIDEVLIFGSRALGNFKNSSDVDLALKGNIDHNLITKVSRKINSESTLPYKFDIINYKTISNLDLKKHIDDFGKRMF